MAKGNPIVMVRVSSALLAEIDAAIASRNDHTSAEPYDRSAFIRAAIREKLDHYRRSKCKRNAAVYHVTNAEPTGEPKKDGGHV